MTSRTSNRRARRTDSPQSFRRPIRRSRGRPTFRSTSWPTPSTSSRLGRNAEARTDRDRASSMRLRYSRRLGIPQDIVDRYLERLKTALGSLADGHGGRYQRDSAGRPMRASQWYSRMTSISCPRDVRQPAAGRQDDLSAPDKPARPGRMRFARAWSRVAARGRDPMAACQKSSRRRRDAASDRPSRSPSLTAILPTSITTSVTTARATTSARSPARDSTSASTAAIGPRSNAHGTSGKRPFSRSGSGARSDRVSTFSRSNTTRCLQRRRRRASSTTCRWGSRIELVRARVFHIPYFPFCLAKNRPYDVVEISLFFMDVTLRSYMGLRPQGARDVIVSGLKELQRKHGAVSVVWHPIVFGAARDPGYDRLYWDLVERVQAMGGLATDGRTINAFWRERARCYSSFVTAGASRGRIERDDVP